MSKRALLIAAVLGFGVAMSPRQAAADAEGNVYWSTAATACTPSPPTIENNRHTYWWNYLSWNGTNLDAITMYCSVQPNESETEPNTLYLTALDNTGTASDTYVDADLVRISRSGGGYAVIASASTDDNATTTVKQVTGAISEALDFETYYYYVRVSMDRDGTGDDARFYGTALDYDEP
jgi:hypothetical protein